MAPSLLDTTWSILDHGLDKYSGTEMRSVQRAAVPISAGQLQGLESWQDHAVFPSTLPLYLSSLMSAEAATVFCERNNVTCAGTCVFAILRWVLQLLGSSLELQLQGKKGKEKKGKRKMNFFSLLAVDRLFIWVRCVVSKSRKKIGIVILKIHKVNTKTIPMIFYPRILSWWTLHFRLLKVGSVICCVL